MNLVLITGASSGLGAEFARQLDRYGEGSCKYTDTDGKEKPLITEDTCFWLIARRGDRLASLSKELRHKSRIFPLDLRDDTSFSILESTLKSNEAYLSVFVNAAGLGYYGNVDQLTFSQLSAMLDVNVKANTMLINLVSPYLVPGAWVVQAASSAAFLPQPGFSVYAASKSYVYSLSRALRREWKRRRIHVTALCPGPVSTEFFQVAETSHYTMPAYKKLFFSQPEPVVKKCLKDVRRNRSKSVYGFTMKLFRILCRMLPWKLLLKFF
jgi:short-subunit dehydrogenase